MSGATSDLATTDEHARGVGSPGASDLRARRRQQTSEQISAAAVRLFEARGVRGTTVDDVAREAGVSRRTFFRYFATKEDAALHRFIEVAEAVGTLSFSGVDAEQAFRMVWQLYAGLLEKLQESPAEYLAVQRLILREEPLRLAAAIRTRALADLLHERLVAGLGVSKSLESHLIVEVSSAVLHATLSEWGEHSDASSADLESLYRRAVEVAGTLLMMRGDTDRHTEEV